MFKALVEKLIEHHSKELPFVMYRKPKGLSVTALLQEDNQLHHSQDFTETGFIFSPFDNRKDNILLHVDERLHAAFTNSQSSSTEVHKVVTENQKAFHIELVRKGIAAITDETFDKVVLSRRVETSCSENLFGLFEKITATYNNAFCYLWYHPKVGTWLGATPEILVKVENQNFTTMSLAGTQQYVEGRDPQWGAKEIEEQQLVTKYLEEALESKTKNLQISETESVRSGQLWHLRNKLSGTMKDASLLSILTAIHPTPAVCGTPMKTAKNFILRNENYDRAFYTGFLGEINMKTEQKRSRRNRNIENQVYKTIKKSSELYVNLRCMQLQNNSALIYVGGGITKSSDAEKEWFETVAKAETMLRMIGGA